MEIHLSKHGFQNRKKCMKKHSETPHENLTESRHWIRICPIYKGRESRSKKQHVNIIINNLKLSVISTIPWRNLSHSMFFVIKRISKEILMLLKAPQSKYETWWKEHSRVTYTNINSLGMTYHHKIYINLFHKKEVYGCINFKIFQTNAPRKLRNVKLTSI